MPTTLRGKEMPYKIEREPTGAGEILQVEFLTPLGMTQKQFADHLDCDVKVINRVVNGRTSVVGSNYSGKHMTQTGT